jgi:hypothetical protein
VLVAAAACPHPPLLVPEAMGAHGVAADDSRIPELRAACGAAVADLAAAHPDLIVVVGGADQTAEYEPSAAGSLRAFGIPFTTGSGPPVLPLSLTVGAWLMRRFLLTEAGCEPPRIRLQAVRQSLPAAGCLRLGAALAALAPRVALLVLGDATARKVIGVRGAADPAAEKYDAEVTAALAGADPARLARLDATLDGDLMITGRAAWQVLAGAAAGESGGLRGELRFAGAPLDVTYLVASWRSQGE